MKYPTPPKNYKHPHIDFAARFVLRKLIRWAYAFCAPPEQTTFSRAALMPARFTIMPSAAPYMKANPGFELVATDGKSFAAVPVAVRGNTAALYGLAGIGKPLRFSPEMLAGAYAFDVGRHGGTVIVRGGHLGNFLLKEEGIDTPTERACTMNSHSFPKIENVLPEAIGGTVPRTHAATTMVMNPLHLARVGHLWAALAHLPNSGARGITLRPGEENAPFSFISSPINDRIFSEGMDPAEEVEDLYLTRRAVAVAMPLRLA